MSEKKKTSLFAIVLGIIIIVVGAFMIFFYLKAPRYTATVTKVSNVYKTTQRSGNRRKRKYKEEQDEYLGTKNYKSQN